jgi:hypothetical protein
MARRKGSAWLDLTTSTSNYILSEGQLLGWEILERERRVFVARLMLPPILDP